MFASAVHEVPLFHASWPWRAHVLPDDPGVLRVFIRYEVSELALMVNMPDMPERNP